MQYRWRAHRVHTCRRNKLSGLFETDRNGEVATVSKVTARVATVSKVTARVATVSKVTARGMLVPCIRLCPNYNIFTCDGLQCCM